LPQFNDYYMVGYGGPDWEKEPPAIAQYTTNYTPYTSITGTDIINVTMDLGAFTHGNYAYHAGNYNDSVEKRGAPAIEWPVNNVPKKIGEWQDLRGTFPVNRTSITATYSDRTYTISNFPSGHYVIYQVYLGHNSTHSTYSRLYRKGGGPCTDYTPIYAFLNVGYRDMEGNKIIGAPEDLDNKSKRVVTWLNGNTGKKFTFSPDGGSVTLDLKGLDEIGWRYKGYKYMKTLDIPENVSPTGLNGANSGEIDTALGNQVHALVFFFEPIKVTVNHINEDREKIDTNKNVEYKLPEILSLAGHTCESLECEHKTISEAGKVPGDTAKKHNNTSLNKYLWPGYILKGWEMKQDNPSEKVFKSESYDENTTTRVATAEDITQYGGNIPREIYQKTVEITTDINTGEDVGYRSDIILDFIYKNVYITVNHLKYEDNTHLTSLSGNPLWYKKILNGHFFTVSSLVTQGTNILPETGDEYNISGRIIKRITITKKGGRKSRRRWKLLEKRI